MRVCYKIDCTLKTFLFYQKILKIFKNQICPSVLKTREKTFLFPPSIFATFFFCFFVFFSTAMDKLEKFKTGHFRRL